MNNYEIIKKFQELKESTQALAYKNKTEKDKIKKRLEMLIRNKFGNESHHLKDLLDVEFYYHPIMWFVGQDFSREDRECWEEGKQQWCNLIDTLIEEIISFPSEKEITQTTIIQTTESNQSKKIFVVHGHDNEMVHAAARFITQLGFEPVILREQPNQGRTIIEKFEDYADVPFAIVLFSPDDLGKSKDDENLNPRPRQNVVFELGFFIGKLARKNVVVLHREVDDFEMLSDYKGVLFEPYRDGWEFKVAKEIIAAGFEVDLNRLAK